MIGTSLCPSLVSAPFRVRTGLPNPDAVRGVGASCASCRRATAQTCTMYKHVQQLGQPWPQTTHVCVIDPQNASAMSGSSTPSSPLVDAMASGGLPVRVSDRSLRQNLCRTGVPCLGTHIGEGGRRAVNGAWLSGTRLVCDWMGIAPVRTFSTGFPILHMSSYFTPPWR